MTILEYSECNSIQKSHWLEQIKKADWRAAEYLANILENDEFYKIYGSSSKIFLLAENENLISFCTFAEKDDIPHTEFSPWIGFVYTFPQYRGKRMMGVLFNHIFDIAKSQEINSIYISTHDKGIYEKYGFTFSQTMNDSRGEQSRIYKITFKQ